MNLPTITPFLHTAGTPTIPWSRWIRSFDSYLLAMGGKKFGSSRQAAVLLSCVGDEARRVFYSIPDVDESKYEDVKQALAEHFEKKVNTTMARYKFRQRKQLLEETISSYSVALHELANDCCFGDSYEECMLDQFIVGLLDNSIRKQLLVKSKLTFEKAFDIASCHEQVSEESKTFITAPNSSEEQVLQTTARHHSSSFKKQKFQDVKKSQSGQCFSCGDNHLRKDCKFRNATCHNCNKVGHIKKVCRAVKVNGVDTNDSSDSSLSATILTILNGSQHHILQPIYFSSDSYEFIVDTGSPVSIIPMNVLKKVVSNVKISRTNTKVHGVTGHSLQILGECNCSVSSSPKSPKVTIRFLVSNNSPAILGLDALRALDINISLRTSTPPNMENSECIQKCSKVSEDISCTQLMETTNHVMEASLIIQPLQVDRNTLIMETKKAYGAVLSALKGGWSISAKKKFPDLYAQREELSNTPDGLILTKDRIIIPPPCRQAILHAFHDGHLGVKKMKSMAHMSCWWSSINCDIKKKVNSCKQCIVTKFPTQNKLNPWPTTFKPWQRIHADGTLLRNSEHLNTQHRPAPLFKGRTPRSHLQSDSSDVTFFKENNSRPSKWNFNTFTGSIWLQRYGLGKWNRPSRNQIRIHHTCKPLEEGEDGARDNT